jgi:uncharacterized protein YbbC (DUF1343 family)
MMRIGLECCQEQAPEVLRRGRFGLLMNQASVTAELEDACEVLHRQYPGQLAALFSPQHGLWGQQQANMIESPHTRHPRLGLPVYSLYAETRCPTAEMLHGLDALVIDLQDVGTRVYTFVWTMLECLKACATAGVSVLVLDRPNPIGGEIVEGPVLESNFLSFVGGACIPMRHGLTIAELARLCVAEHRIDVQLDVVPMRGWRRSSWFSELGRRWVWPSPNMPSLDTATLYPGQVLLEGTGLSEGRGTTRPFEVIGAPYLDPDAWRDAMQDFAHPGVQLRPLRFIPTFDKWRGRNCSGLDILIVDPKAVRSVELTVSLLATAVRLAPEEFRWLPPPYEYEYEKPPIDILFGSERLRVALQTPGLNAAAVEQLVAVDAASWWQRVRPYLLY